MTEPSGVPSELIEGERAAETRGLVDGDWYYEEGFGAVRFGIRVEALLHEETSEYQKLAVYDTPFFGKMLTLDGVMMFTERDEFVYHEMLTHVPLCSVPGATDVLIVGGGDCGCLREVLRHDSVRRVVQCDIDERVTRVCEKFFPWVQPAASDPRAELVFDDGVRFIEQNENAFDVVIIDSTDPRGPGVGLFLADFYAKVARALKPGGVMTAQTESPHWDPRMVGAIYGQMRRAFGHVSAYTVAVPVYPSGLWSLAYASNDRRHTDFFDAERAAGLEEGSKYYDRGVHSAAFSLPRFARAATEGRAPFREFDDRVRVGSTD